MILLMLSASLIVGFNMGLQANSPEEAGVNETVRDNTLGVNRSLETFPNSSEDPTKFEKPEWQKKVENQTNGLVAGDPNKKTSDWIKNQALKPALKSMLAVIDWAAYFAYQHQHWPEIVFEGIIFGLQVVAVGIFGMRIFSTVKQARRDSNA